jgi:hypothetical protein
VSEEAIAHLAMSRDADEICDSLLAESVELGAAMRRFFEKRERVAEIRKHRGRPDTPHQPRRKYSHTATLAPAAMTQLTAELRQCSADCRSRRTELSLLLFDVHGAAFSRADTKELATRVRDAFDRACRALELPREACDPLGATLTAAIVTNCDRREAVTLAQRLIDICRRDAFRDWPPAAKRTPLVHVGVATATHISKNFAVESLLSGAERCLAAAQSCGASAVKSIEVF